MEIVYKNIQTKEVKKITNTNDEENFIKTIFPQILSEFMVKNLDLSMEECITNAKEKIHDDKFFNQYSPEWKFASLSADYTDIIETASNTNTKRTNKKTKERGNGEGTIYYSETLKCYVAQYVEPSGKRKTLKQKKNEKVGDFKKRFNEVITSLNKGTYLEKNAESIYSLDKHHIEMKFQDGKTSARSYRRDLETLAQIEKTCINFCYIPIQKVTIKHIEDAKKEISKYSNSCITKIWIHLNKVFKIACSPSRRILIYNIMQDENLSKPLSIHKTKKITSLTSSERTKLIHILDHEEKEHKYRDIVKMQLISSMRIAEVLARSDDDFNEEKQIFNVHNTLTQDENYNVIWSDHTKTFNKETGIDEGQRFLPLGTPLFSELLDILKKERQIRKVISINNVHKVIFWDDKKDTFITPSEINSWLLRLNKKYNICKGNLTTHRIRHTAISFWNELGIPLPVIQYLAGHVEGSDITQESYIDISTDYVINMLSQKNLKVMQ